MRLILLLLFFVIWIHHQIFSFGSQTVTETTASTTTKVIDLQDGHPNHRLWQKMIETERASSIDWYVNNLNLFFISYRYLSILSFYIRSLIKLI
jgi:hypothetical protein